MLQYYLGISQKELNVMSDEEWYLKFLTLEYIRVQENQKKG